ncbi:hypothetical protein BKN38_07310 [Helicobacter sp. CLO-3]|nr:hypothetical protein BKN38_07310 [Helicobacter sp. CLO-3]
MQKQKLSASAKGKKQRAKHQKAQVKQENKKSTGAKSRKPKRKILQLEKSYVFSKLDRDIF